MVRRTTKKKATSSRTTTTRRRKKSTGEPKKKIYKTDMKRVKQKLAEIGSGTFFKANEGTNKVRILPPWSDSGEFYKETRYHFGLKRDGKNITLPYLGEDSAMMKFIRKLEKGGTADKKLAKRLYPKTKFYVNIIDRATDTIKIWGFSRQTLNILLSNMQDPDIGDITDLEEGHDVVIERHGQGLDTEYQIRVRPKKTEVGDVDLSKMFDLDQEVESEITNSEVSELIKENFGQGKGRDEEDDDDDDEEEEDEEYDEEEDDEEDEDDEEEEDEDEDDDDEEEDDDEDEEDEDDEEEEEDEGEEEEAPKKRRTRKRAPAKKKRATTTKRRTTTKKRRRR